MTSLVQNWALPASAVAIASTALAWYKQVSEHVSDPYLVSNAYTQYGNI
jgi:hypothetical protein